MRNSSLSQKIVYLFSQDENISVTQVLQSDIPSFDVTKFLVTLISGKTELSLEQSFGILEITSEGAVVLKIDTVEFTILGGFFGKEFERMIHSIRIYECYLYDLVLFPPEMRKVALKRKCDFFGLSLEEFYRFSQIWSASK